MRFVGNSKAYVLRVLATVLRTVCVNLMLKKLAENKFYSYICTTETSDHNRLYVGLPVGKPAVSSATVDCFGVSVPAAVDEVQRVLTTRGLTAAEQAEAWLELARQYPDPDWMERCLAAARRMTALVEAEREVRATLGTGDGSALGLDGRRRPASSLAERHFEWLGASRGVLVESVRGGIAALAARGFISPDAEQQAALRCGLGLTLNTAERTQRAPWVRWLGDSDVLNYLVDSLWEHEVIYCSGGRRLKWQTLCGVFLRSDGTCFEPSIKNNRCTNTEKRRVIDSAFLGALMR